MSKTLFRNTLLSYVQKGSAIVPGEGWQLALHFDLQPCLSKGLIEIPRSVSQ